MGRLTARDSPHFPDRFFVDHRKLAFGVAVLLGIVRGDEAHEASLAPLQQATLVLVHAA